MSPLGTLQTALEIPDLGRRDLQSANRVDSGQPVTLCHWRDKHRRSSLWDLALGKSTSGDLSLNPKISSRATCSLGSQVHCSLSLPRVQRLNFLSLRSGCCRGHCWYLPLQQGVDPEPEDTR